MTWENVEWRELKEPERPTLRKLREKNGDPPWALEVPDYGLIPPECSDLVGTLVWRGIKFDRREQ